MRLALAAAVLLGLVAAGCGDAAVDPAPETGAQAAGWTEVADPPFAQVRHSPLLAWTGTQVLSLGGHTKPPCPDNASCAVVDDWAADGAAYDPAADTWSAVADPPFHVDRYTPHVVTDDGTLVIAAYEGDGGWWAFDGTAWAAVAGAPADVVPESTMGGLVYGHDRHTVHVLDVALGSWSTLPPDDLQPGLRDGSVFATSAGVVVTGVNYDEPAPDEPTLTQADLWDGTSWVRLPRTGMIGPLLHWTGARLLSPAVGSADGGEVDNWGRSYPFGGALDPATGAWSAISGTPDYDDLRQSDWKIEAAEGPVVATAGYVYDDRDGSWARLGRPSASESALVPEEVVGVWADGRLVVVGRGETWVTDAATDPQQR